MTPDPNRSEKSDPVETNPTETLALEHPDEIQFGITRGESDLEIGPLRDDPDQVDVSIRPEDERVVRSVDAMAGDHGTGHVDTPLYELV